MKSYFFRIQFNFCLQVMGIISKGFEIENCLKMSTVVSLKMSISQLMDTMQHRTKLK